MRQLLLTKSFFLINKVMRKVCLNHKKYFASFIYHPGKKNCVLYVLKILDEVISLHNTHKSFYELCPLIIL